MVLKLERFSHLLGQSFGLGSPIGLKALSLVLSLRRYITGERYLGKGYLEEGTKYPKEGQERMLAKV